ncbi:MAG: DUF5069 domain-containing protein [bacterium]
MPTPSPLMSGKDLTKGAPRSPHEILDGYAIVARTIDKCRAELWGNIGEYHFDCPLDKQFFGFKEIQGADFKAFVAEGHTDEEILSWVTTHGTPKTADEIAAWTKGVIANNYSSLPDKKPWLEGENIRLGLDKDATLFDMLDADDVASFRK